MYIRSGLVALAAAMIASSHAAAQVSVSGNTVKEYETRAGGKYAGSIVVMNSSDEPQEVKLYQTDYFADATGMNLYGDPGTSARSNARWVTVGASAVVIPPRASREVSFTVAVPNDARLTGTYWSMVMVEGVPRGAPGSMIAPERNKVQMGIATRIRYAVQVVTHVGTDGKTDAKFEAPSVQLREGGTRMLQVDVKNTGTRSFSPLLTLELYSADGTRVKSLTARREMTYPGTSIRQFFDLGALPGGKYTAIVTLDAGGDAIFGAQYTLNL